MEINPDELSSRSRYKIMTGSIVPRPIGWISTVNDAGEPNLAPFSYFNLMGCTPPVLVFSPGVRTTDGKPKDTLLNVRRWGEFVVNLVTEETAAAMNITATEFPAEVNEFEAAGLTPVPSTVVRPPRVAESPIHFECHVIQIVEVGEGAGESNIVVGRVVHMHVSDEVLFDGDKIDIRRLKPIGRLAGSGYCRVTDLFELKRPPSQVKRG